MKLSIGNTKVGIILFIVLTLTMAAGTLIESFCGTRFATVVIYRSYFFMALLGLVFMSVLAAMINYGRFLKGHTIGFHLLHLGVLMILAGAFITFYAGVDGVMTLLPKIPERQISLATSMLAIEYRDDENNSHEITSELPDVMVSRTLQRNIDTPFGPVTLGQYVPFAAYDTQMQPEAGGLTATYFLKHKGGDQTTQMMTDIVHKTVPSTFANAKTRIFFLNPAAVKCLEQLNTHELIIWDRTSRVCRAPADFPGYRLIKSKLGNSVVEIPFQDRVLRFFPAMFALPITADFKLVEDSDLFCFTKAQLAKQEVIFLFGDFMRTYDFVSATWRERQFTEQNSSTYIAETGTTIGLISIYKNVIPTETIVYRMPTAGREERSIEALGVTFNNKTAWITPDRPIQLGAAMTAKLTKRKLQLPFELILKQFTMQQQPGTDRPASFDSFVDIFTGETTHAHHINMNHPLKYGELTFYQSSYFQLEDESYASQLSVNIDPGRTIKYVGAILLVLGGMVHYFWRRSRFLMARRVA